MINQQVGTVRDDINRLGEQLSSVENRDKRFESEMSGVNYLIQKMRSRMSGLAQKLSQIDASGGTGVAQTSSSSQYELRQEISKLKLTSGRVIQQG